ncbi:MAG: asparaginase, partial [Nitriliruptoraceae bacterium]
MPTPPILAEVTRRDVRTGQAHVESVHAGDLVVATVDGTVVLHLGAADRTIVPRSAVKPFQAAACLELLATHGPVTVPAADLAVAWASHRGEAAQLAAVRRLLERARVDPSALTCPPAVAEATPGAAPSRLQHNCSGKHALFALAGRALGCSTDALLDPDGELQRAVLGTVARWVGPLEGLTVDGCGAPAVLVPLRRLAAGFAALAVDDELAAVRAAGLAHPELVGGSGRLESALLAAGAVAKV